MVTPGSARGNTYLSLRLIKNAVHCVQQSHLLIKVQNCLFGELSRGETHKTTNSLTLAQQSVSGVEVIVTRGVGQADCTWGSWEGLMMLPCLSITRYTGIPEMTLGWMNSRWSTNSAEAPGNCGFSSDESKGCCRCTAWKVECKHYLLIMSLWQWQRKALSTIDTTKGIHLSLNNDIQTNTHCSCSVETEWGNWPFLHDVILQKVNLTTFFCFKNVKNSWDCNCCKNHRLCVHVSALNIKQGDGTLS